jgi:hypothetical protein
MVRVREKKKWLGHRSWVMGGHRPTAKKIENKKEIK